MLGLVSEPVGLIKLILTLGQLIGEFLNSLFEFFLLKGELFDGLGNHEFEARARFHC